MKYECPRGCDTDFFIKYGKTMCRLCGTRALEFTKKQTRATMMKKEIIISKKTGVELVSIERQEQIEKHGFDAEHDANRSNSEGELMQGALYLLSGTDAGRECSIQCRYPILWKDSFMWKFDNKSNMEKLITAGALICAEIDRINAVKQ